MELKPAKNWSLCMHGQCIDMVSNLHDAFIGGGGKYKFVYQVKRIDDKCETEVIINLKRQNWGVEKFWNIKYMLNWEIPETYHCWDRLQRIYATLSEIEMKQHK